MKCIYDPFTEDSPYSIKVRMFFVIGQIITVRKQQEFEASLVDATIHFNLFNGLVKIQHSEGLSQEARLWSISPVETVNGHQWTGYGTVDIKHKHAPFNVKDTDRPLWDIASVDHRSGRRILFVRTHSGRDHVFMVTNRLNMLFNHARETLEPWREEMVEYCNQGYHSVSDVPEDEQENLREGLAERIKAFGKPDWDWT